MLSVAKVNSKEDKCNSSVLNSLKMHFVGETLNTQYETLLKQFDEPDAENGWNQSAASVKTKTKNDNPYCRVMGKRGFWKITYVFNTWDQYPQYAPVYSSFGIQNPEERYYLCTQNDKK